MFTELEGRISFITRIPKTAKGKIKKQYFQPLTMLDLEFDYRPRTSLQRIKEVRILRPYGSIPFDPAKSAILLFLQNSFIMLHVENSRTSIYISMCVQVWNGWMKQNMTMQISTLSS